MCFNIMLIKIRNVRANVKQIGRKNVYSVGDLLKLNCLWQIYIDLANSIWDRSPKLG